MSSSISTSEHHELADFDTGAPITLGIFENGSICLLFMQSCSTFRLSSCDDWFTVTSNMMMRGSNHQSSVTTPACTHSSDPATVTHHSWWLPFKQKHGRPVTKSSASHRQSCCPAMSRSRYAKPPPTAVYESSSSSGVFCCHGNRPTSVASRHSGPVREDRQTVTVNRESTIMGQKRHITPYTKTQIVGSDISTCSGGLTISRFESKGRGQILPSGIDPGTILKLGGGGRRWNIFNSKQEQ